VEADTLAIPHTAIEEQLTLNHTVAAAAIKVDDIAIITLFIRCNLSITASTSLANGHFIALIGNHTFELGGVFQFASRRTAISVFSVTIVALFIKVPDSVTAASSQAHTCWTSQILAFPAINNFAIDATTADASIITIFLVTDDAIVELAIAILSVFVANISIPYMASDAKIRVFISFTSLITLQLAIMADRSADAHKTTLDCDFLAVPTIIHNAIGATVVRDGVIIIAHFATFRLNDTVTTDVAAL